MNHDEQLQRIHTLKDIESDAMAPRGGLIDLLDRLFEQRVFLVLDIPIEARDAIADEEP